MLGSSATKREARSYLQRFNPPADLQRTTKSPTVDQSTKSQEHASNVSGVNLGAFYGHSRAVEDSPKFIQHPQKQTKRSKAPQLHVSLVKIRDPQHMDDNTLNGIGKTLSQLARLGLTSVVVVDCSESGAPGLEEASDPNWKVRARDQASRLVAAVDANGKPGSRLLDDIIGIDSRNSESKSSASIDSGIHVSFPKLLLTPLKKGIIPVIPSIGYSDECQLAVPVHSSDIILALAKELSGIQIPSYHDEDPSSLKTRIQEVRDGVSVDRLIILDPLGGIPGTDRPNGYHVFLNMEEEYNGARQKLLDLSDCQVVNIADIKENSDSNFVPQEYSREGTSNRFGDPKRDHSLRSVDQAKRIPSMAAKIHLDNLDLVRNVLTILPRSSSALLTTPEEVAKSAMQEDIPFQAAGVGTRRLRNPLIHNLLTDKPVFSSSLPLGRLGILASAGEESLTPTAPVIATTFAKHGMPITIFPDPSASPWEPPEAGKTSLNLTDPQIDLSRLVYLIEDSFDRKLDVKAYLDRVQGHIAGVIIAGEYEGGAILTWEVPPGVVDDGSPESRARMVPYLDKFAVLKRSQGSAGVADVLFTSMVRDCFPGGVMWRSRKNNPVNKWYFERSRGTWKIPDTNWTMFWTTPERNLDRQKFLDYEGICRGILPSWADNKSVVD